MLDAAPDPKEGWFATEAGHEDLVCYGSLDAVQNSTRLDTHATLRSRSPAYRELVAGAYVV